MAGSVPSRKGRLAAIDGALALLVVLLIVQMWLLTATLEAYLGGDRAAAIPAAVASGLLFLGCAALTAFSYRVDREARAKPSLDT